MSFRRRPSSGRPLQASHREDRHIVRSTRVQPTASSFAIQAQVAPSLGAPGSSRIIRRHLAEGHLGSWRPLRLLPTNRWVSQDCLRTVTTLSWPAQSPDLSSIEHIRDHLPRRVVHPTSLTELEARLQQIWNEMSQDIIQNLYASMPDRIASCICSIEGVQQDIKSPVLLPLSLK
ncbi:transposable element Tcb1 transposase [Trichonephila clavipes]|nr:transposable element Tcb1 transposase [Trichonephila clavipes]